MDAARIRALLGDAAAEFDRRMGAVARPDIPSVLLSMADAGLLSDALVRDLLVDGDTAVTLTDAGPRLPGPTYRVVGLLGRGAMGEVHVARDRKLGRNIAIKRMDPALVDHPVLNGRFVAEAQITAQLDHPGVVPVYGLEVGADGVPQYAMKLIKGRTLADYLDQCRAFHERGERPDERHDLKSRLEIFVELCYAVAYAHERGVVHRDLKPDNVMLGSFGEVVVMDWGVAKVLSASVESDAPADAIQVEGGRVGTEAGVVVGTAPYCSPEQAAGQNASLDARSDQYALGLLLFELVALKRAITGATPYLVLLRAHAGEKDPFEHAFGEPIPHEIVAIVDKATAKAPGDRYPTVSALADEVRRVLRDEEVRASPDVGVRRLQRWVSHHRQATLAVGAGLVAALVTVALLGLVGALVAVELSRQEAARREQALGRALARVEEQAAHLDVALLRTEASVSRVAGAAAVALRSPPPGDVVVFDDYAAAPPADLQASTFYEGRVSLDHVDVHRSPGVDALAVAAQQAQLASLVGELRASLVSADADAARLSAPDVDRRIVDDGLLAAWSYVATPDGVLAGYPGFGVYPDSYDPRSRPWYGAAAAARGPVWSSLGVDDGDLGLLLTCSEGVRHPDGTLAAVAAVDLDFARFIERFLDPSLDVPHEAWLLDEAGRVAIRSSQREIARTLTAYEPEPFPVPAVWEAATDAAAGFLVSGADDDARLYVWVHLSAVPWTYVVEGDVDDLVGVDGVFSAAAARPAE
jgi:serine/threonine protein kinase